MKLRVNLDNSGEESMRLERVAKNYARLKYLFTKHNVESKHMFNLHKSGYIMRGMNFGKAKCVVEKKARGDTANRSSKIMLIKLRYCLLFPQQDNF